MNFGINEIDKTIRDCKELELVDKSDKGLIITLPEDIVNLFNDYSFPTIHNMLEVLLYYVTYTNRIIELDNYLYYLLGEEHISDVTLYKLISIIEEHNVTNRINDILRDKVNNPLNHIYFAGWLLNKKNVNFYTSFDLIILTGNKSIGDS